MIYYIVIILFVGILLSHSDAISRLMDNTLSSPSAHIPTSESMQAESSRTTTVDDISASKSEDVRPEAEVEHISSQGTCRRRVVPYG